MSTRQENLRKHLWSLLALSVLIIFAVGSTETDTGSDSGDPDVAAVRGTMTNASATGRETFRSGPLEGGTAVLVDDLAAYWVKDGKVYAANGIAKTWSPGISYATSGKITLHTVKSAVR